MSWFNKKKGNVKRGLSNDEVLKILRRIGIFSNLMKSGLIYLDVKKKQVVIHETLAVLFLADQQRWTNFLKNIQMWFLYQISQMEWNKFFLDAELNAVTKAKKKYPMMTVLQEREVRMNARQTVCFEDVKQPKIESYNFVISGSLKNDDKPSIVMIGVYNDGVFDMIPYEDVLYKNEN